MRSSGRNRWESIVSILRNRGLLASVGVATATVTSFAGFVPAVVSTAGAVDGTDGANTAAAEPTADGTYDSCSPYFGYGKNEVSGFDALDITTFPVTVEGGTPDGEAPTVENGGIDVVLVLTDVDGDELLCVPDQVTKAEWDATWDAIPIDDLNIPAWPGPGHYAYPTIPPDEGPVEEEELLGLGSAPTAIGDLGELASVGFEVVGVPDGYTLVDPLQIQELPQVFFDSITDYVLSLDSGEVPAPVLAVIEEAAGPGAAEAFTDAAQECLAADPDGPDPVLPEDPDLVAAVNALLDVVAVPGFPPVVLPVTCDDVLIPVEFGVFVFALNATIENESPITVSLPVEPTTTTTAAAPPAAQAARVTPAFTG